MRRCALAALVMIGFGAHLVAAQTPPGTAGSLCGRLETGDAKTSPQFSPARLVAVHDCLAAHPAPRGMVDPLEKAGVAMLLTTDGGLPPEQRLRILNDYGAWLAAEGPAHARAIEVLKRVVQLAPERAQAWLDLGDAYRGELTDIYATTPADDVLEQRNATWEGKAAITRQALDAYQQYVALTPDPTPRVASFLSLNMLNAPAQAPCAYVAAFANANREKELYAEEMSDETPQPVDLLGDGTKYFVFIRSEGAAQVPAIYITRTPPGPLDYYPRRDPKFPFGGDFDERQAADEYHLISIKNKYYFVHDAWGKGISLEHRTFPAEILDPTGVRVCGIQTRIEPRLLVDADGKICDEFLHATLAFEKIVIPPSAAEDHLRESGLPGATLAGAITLDWQNDGRPQSVAAYRYESANGLGCARMGLTLFDEATGRAVESPLNAQLARLPQDCHGGTTNLIRLGKRVYIEVERGAEQMPGQALGMGLYAVVNDQLGNVCVVDNHATFAAD